MDDVTQHVRIFMTAMHEVCDELSEMVRQLYKRAEVRLASQFGPSPYLSCEFGVSAELRDGAVVDFWIEQDATDAGWNLHPRILRHDPDEDGCHTERDLGLRTVDAAEALPTALAQALRDLRAAVGEDRLFRECDRLA